MAKQIARLKKENVSVFDVWTSQSAFDAFGQTMVPVLQAAEAKARKPAKEALKTKKRPKSPKSPKSSKKR